MPPGSGTYEVTGNETTIGDFPAGETVSLGSLWESNAIKVVEANVPAAYVYIPSQLSADNASTAQRLALGATRSRLATR